MPNARIKLIIIASLFVLVLVGLYFLLKPNEATPTERDLVATKSTASKPTIATEWQWVSGQPEVLQTNTTDDTNTVLPFTEESVYIALQAVKLDEGGDIILDHDALISLDEALERIHNRLNQASLEALQELIKQSLPGKAGTQTAELVKNYYDFLEAKEEFSRINEAMADTNNENSLQALEINVQLYAELQALRERYLGYEATESLFRVSDANAKYMFDSMKLALNDQLTNEERLEQRKIIEAEHLEQSINITNWPSRYSAFNNEKQYIVASSISDDDKRQQLETLLSQHFDEEERKRIEHLGLTAF
jgi:lipase chaperone LimK